jgi:hypothetical protein
MDVLTAANVNLNFSSDWSAITLLASGKAYVTGTTVIPFGKTFSRVPQVIVPYNFQTAELGYNWSYLQFNDLTLGLNGVARVFNDRLELYANTWGPVYMGYFIWDYAI